MEKKHLFIIRDARQLPKHITVNQGISLGRVLDFVVTGSRPLRRMTDSAGSDHIQIDIDNTSKEMSICFNSGSVVTVFPESPFPVFSLIKFLGGSAGDKLNAFGNNILAAIQN
jgi:hypothetical protein